MTHTETIYMCDALGNTYPHKETLKKFGFQFNGAKRIWECFMVTGSDKDKLETMAKKWQGVNLKFYSPKKSETPF